jgi:nucleoside-diphosphate-sugar epimerase
LSSAVSVYRSARAGKDKLKPMSLHRVPEPVLVLGATSLIGRYLLPRLADMRAVTVALSRRRHGLDPGGARWICGDLETPDAIAFPYAETAFGLCPIWSLTAALPALKAAGLKRLVAFSSTSVTVKAASSDESERRVAARLAEAEMALRRFCEANDVAWTVLRPTLIYSEGLDGNVSRLARMVERFGVLPLAGKGEGLRQPVHAEDLAWAATAAAASPLAAGRAYDLPGGETLTYRQMVERIFFGMDRTPRILCAPLPLWRLGFRLAGDRLPGATAAMGERMNQDLAFDGEPATRDFGWAPRGFKPVFPHVEAVPEA